jgi:hypothetical protein
MKVLGQIMLYQARILLSHSWIGFSTFYAPLASSCKYGIHNINLNISISAKTCGDFCTQHPMKRFIYLKKEW